MFLHNFKRTSVTQLLSVRHGAAGIHAVDESRPVCLLLRSTLSSRVSQGSYISTDLNAASSEWELVTGLENMPNLGTVSVVEKSNDNGGSNGFNTSVWEISFTSEVGPFPALKVSAEKGKSLAL